MTRRFGRIFSEDSSGRSRVGIVDYDQRRAFYLEGPTQLVGERDGTEYTTLEQHPPHITPDTKTVVIGGNGQLEKLFPSLPEVHGNFPPRYTLEGVKRPSLSSSHFREWPTIHYHELTEVDRLGGGIDLVQHPHHPGKKLVFKYALVHAYVERMWNELPVLTSLPGHPGITPLDKVVLGDVDLRIIGMTTLFMEGGDFLHDCRSRPFKLEWPQQLTDVLDFLHLKMGLIHGNLNTRNVLLGLQTDSLRTSGFGHARDITTEGVKNELEQAKRFTYELATGDGTFMVDAIHGISSDGSKIIAYIPKLLAEGERDCTRTTLRKHVDTWISWRECLPTPRPMYHVDFQHHDAAIETSPTQEEDDVSVGSMAYSIPWQGPPYREAYPGRTCHAYIQDYGNITTGGPREESQITTCCEYPGTSCNSSGEGLQEYNHDSSKASNDNVSTADQERSLNRTYAREQTDMNQTHQSWSGVAGEIWEGAPVSARTAMSAMVRGNGSPQPETQELRDRMMLPLAPTEISTTKFSHQHAEIELGPVQSLNIDTQRFQNSEAQETRRTTCQGSKVFEVKSLSTDPTREESPQGAGQMAEINLKTEVLDDMPFEESSAGIADYQEAMHGIETSIQDEAVPISPTHLVTMPLASSGEEPTERTNSRKSQDKRAEVPDETSPDMGSDQEYRPLSSGGAVQIEPQCSLNSQPGVDEGLYGDSLPSQNGESLKDAEDNMAHGATYISGTWWQEDVPGKQVAQNASESSGEHLGEEGERSGESMALENSDMHEPSIPIALEPVSHLPSPQQVATDALYHYNEHFTTQHQEKFIDASYRDSFTESPERRNQSEVEGAHLHPSSTPMDFSLKASLSEGKRRGVKTTNKRAPIGSDEEKAMTTPNPAVSRPSLLQGMEDIPTNGRKPLPIRTISSRTTQNKQLRRRKRLVSPDTEWTFMPGRPAKNSKILDPKLGLKEKPLTSCLNSSTYGSRRRRIQSDMELDLETDIFGPDLLRLAKRPKMAVTEPSQPRATRPKQEKMREKVGEPRTKRNSRDKAATKNSSKPEAVKKTRQNKLAENAEFITRPDSDDELLILRVRASRMRRQDESETSVPGVVGAAQLGGEFTGEEDLTERGPRLLDCDILEAE